MANHRVTPNYRIGAYYGLGSIPVAAVAYSTWPWGGVLYWGALALAISAVGYFGAGPGIYRKKNGCLSLLTKIVMGPVLFGQHLSLLYYRRQGNTWDEAAPGLLMGQLLDDEGARKLLDAGATAVLDLTTEFTENRLLRKHPNYHNLPILDLTAPTPGQLQRAVSFIRDNVQDGIVYVHCKIGYSRSAAVVGAYLMATGLAAGVEEAMATMRDARSVLVIRPEVVTALCNFEKTMKDTDEN